MRAIIDTNVLIRAVVRDHDRQTQIAVQMLRDAEKVVLSTLVLSEMAWVLRRVYSFSKSDIALSIRALMNAVNVETNRSAVESGLKMLDEGGDFADGIIAHEGQWNGGDAFVTFDKEAAELLKKQGRAVVLL